MFRDVPECSGVFRVPGFFDGLRAVLARPQNGFKCLECKEISNACLINLTNGCYILA